MYNRNDRPLGAVAEDAYETLRDAIDPSAGIPIDDARDCLREAGFPDGDAEYALERLLNRGYLYEVDGKLFITEHEDELA